MSKNGIPGTIIACLATDASAASVDQIVAHPYLAGLVIIGIVVAAPLTGRLTPRLLLALTDALAASAACVRKMLPQALRHPGAAPAVCQSRIPPR